MKYTTATRRCDAAGPPAAPPPHPLVGAARRLRLLSAALGGPAALAHACKHLGQQACCGLSGHALCVLPARARARAGAPAACSSCRAMVLPALRLAQQTAHNLPPHALQMLASSRAFVINQFGLSGGSHAAPLSRRACSLVSVFCVSVRLCPPFHAGSALPRPLRVSGVCSSRAQRSPHPAPSTLQPLCGRTARTGLARSTSTCFRAPLRGWTSDLCARHAGRAAGVGRPGRPQPSHPLGSRLPARLPFGRLPCPTPPLRTFTYVATYVPAELLSRLPGTLRL